MQTTECTDMNNQFVKELDIDFKTGIILICYSYLFFYSFIYSLSFLPPNSFYFYSITDVLNFLIFIDIVSFSIISFYFDTFLKIFLASEKSLALGEELKGMFLSYTENVLRDTKSAKEQMELKAAAIEEVKVEYFYYDYYYNNLLVIVIISLKFQISVFFFL